MMAPAAMARVLGWPDHPSSWAVMWAFMATNPRSNRFDAYPCFQAACRAGIVFG